MTNVNKCAVTVQDGTKFKIELLSLKQLYLLGSPGVDGVRAAIDSAKGFLQRLAQKIAWRKKDSKKAKEYIRSLLTGSALLDNFVLVPASLILKSAEQEYQDSAGIEKEARASVLEYIKGRVAEGVEYFIIDGQNRLFESLIPFFTNQLPFDSENALMVLDSQGNKVNLAGKFFNELPKDIQTHIEEIQIPFVVATSGTISAFAVALITKNEGIAWDEWQKMIMNNWYTKFRDNISSIAHEDDGHKPSRDALVLVKGAKYAYDVNGHDKLIAEFLIWMVTTNMPTSNGEFEEFFNGKRTVTAEQIKSVKRYLKSFTLAYGNSKVSNTELRNYIMLCYVLDNPNKFKNLDVPSWKIQKEVLFAGYYKVVTKNLINEPKLMYGEVESYTDRKNPDGSETKYKTPGSYNHFNSENKPGFLTSRIAILLRVLAGQSKNRNCKKVLKDLVEEGIIVVTDQTPMPSIEEIWSKNPNDADGNSIPVSQLNSKNFDRGHKLAQSKGGSNTDVVLQKKRDNRQWQENYKG